MLFWVLAPYRLVGRCQRCIKHRLTVSIFITEGRLGGMAHFSLLSFLWPLLNPSTCVTRHFSPVCVSETLYLPANIHGVKTQKNNIIIADLLLWFWSRKLWNAVSGGVKQTLEFSDAHHVLTPIFCPSFFSRSRVLFPVGSSIPEEAPNGEIVT
jgi:hypothetical protein